MQENNNLNFIHSLLYCSSYQFGINWQTLVRVVLVLHFLVRHELEGTVRNTEDSGNKSFVQSPNAFIAVRLD